MQLLPLCGGLAILHPPPHASVLKGFWNLDAVDPMPCHGSASGAPPSRCPAAKPQQPAPATEAGRVAWPCAQPAQLGKSSQQRLV